MLIECDIDISSVIHFYTRKIIIMETLSQSVLHTVENTNREYYMKMDYRFEKITFFSLYEYEL